MVNFSFVIKIQKAKSLIFSVLFLVVVFVPNITLAFSNASINIGGIGLIPVLAVEHNVAAGEQSRASSGRSRSASTFDLFIQIPVDKNFPELFLKCTVGEQINEATINFNDDRYAIKLKSIVIGSIGFFDVSEEGSTKYSDVSETEATLSMGLRFEQIEWTYDDVTQGFDLSANKLINLD